MISDAIDPDLIPPPPIPPEDDECCQSGCEQMCVFEQYRAEKQTYDEKWGHRLKDIDD